MNELLSAAASQDTTTWPDVVIILGYLVMMCFFMWLLFRDF